MHVATKMLIILIIKINKIIVLLAQVMDKFLEMYNLLRLNHKELENMNRLFISN